MTLSQALNSVATTVAPIFITSVIIAGKTPAPEYVPGPYLGLGIFTIVICLILIFIKLPKINEASEIANKIGYDTGRPNTHCGITESFSNDITYINLFFCLSNVKLSNVK